MALSRPLAKDDGYATPLALVFSLAFALIGSAMIARGVQSLKLAKADLLATQEAYAAEGAQLAAAAAVVRSELPGPYLWVSSTERGWVQIAAEPEITKLAAADADGLDDLALAGLGVRDPAQLKARLQEAAANKTVAVGQLDDAPLWRDCGPSLVSVLGQQTAPSYAARGEPGPDPDTSLDRSSWHIGELWRIRVTTSAGWRDDRIVRFTGSARHPAAVVSRVFAKGATGGDQCEKWLAPFMAN